MRNILISLCLVFAAPAGAGNGHSSCQSQAPEFQLSSGIQMQAVTATCQPVHPRLARLRAVTATDAPRKCHWTKPAKPAVWHVTTVTNG